jgi:hypothetical protein
MAFDPDAYLATSPGGFDPDAYLEEQVDPNLGVGPREIVSQGAGDAALRAIGRGAWALPGMAGLSYEMALALEQKLRGSDKSLTELVAAQRAASRQAESEHPWMTGILRGVAEAPAMTVLPGASVAKTASLGQRALASGVTAAGQTFGLTTGSSAADDPMARIAEGARAAPFGLALGSLAPVPAPRAPGSLTRLETKAGSQAVKAHRASPTDVRNLQNKYGSENVGDEVRVGLRALEAKTPQGENVVPVFGGSKALAENWKAVSRGANRDLSNVKEAVDAKVPGGAVDMETVISRFKNEVLPTVDEPDVRFAYGEDPAKAVTDIIGRAEREYLGPEVEVGRRVDYGPEQRGLGFGAEQVVPGPDATFARTQVGNEQMVQGGLPGVVRQEQTIPGVTATWENPAPVLKEWPGAPGSAIVAKEGTGASTRGLIGEGQSRLFPETMRPKPESGWRPVLDEPQPILTSQGPGMQGGLFGEAAPDTVIPGDPIYRIDPVSQSVAVQPELPVNMSTRRLGDAGPETRRFGNLPLTRAEHAKGLLQDQVFETASARNPNRPSEAISHSPELKAKGGLSRIIKEEGERTVLREFGPAAERDFVRAKDDFALSSDLENIARNAYNDSQSAPPSAVATKWDVARAAERAWARANAGRARLNFGLSKIDKALPDGFMSRQGIPTGTNIAPSEETRFGAIRDWLKGPGTP